ncbi:MAG: cytidylyltransferase domain-containing protein, partial [Thermoleophilaceae bacterium]
MAHRSSDAPVLGIVPARARGNGLVGKNMRLLAGKPLIAHTLEAALESGAIDRLVLSSEGDEILRWCEMHGYETIRRPEELAGDDATVGEVARHAADECDWTGIVAVLEPTSPLRSGASIARAVERFRRDEPDSLSTVIREPHFFWFDESDDIDEPRPLFRERANRTSGRRGVLKETGAIQLVRAEVLRVTASIAGERHALMELPLDESLSVSTFDDLTAIRRRLERGTVVFRMRSSKRVGAGHLYHCLQLAEELTDQSLRFLLVGCDRFVTDALDERGYDWVEETDLTSDLERLKQPGAANVLVNDVLDTEEREVLLARASGYTVVNIEDLGAGARFADWVVNALYSAN